MSRFADCCVVRELEGLQEGHPVGGVVKRCHQIFPHIPVKAFNLAISHWMIRRHYMFFGIH